MKLIVLSKDGTLIKPIFKGRFWGLPDTQTVLPGAREAVAYYHSRGWKIVICANKGLVHAGLLTMEYCRLEMRACLRLFPEIEDVFFCADLLGQSCYGIKAHTETFYNWRMPLVQQLGIEKQFRKPHPGMLLLARHLYNADECWHIGDKPEDEEAAIAGGMNFLDAKIFRSRFLLGVHNFKVSPLQVQFLEGIR